MAKSCSPFPGPAFIERTEANDQGAYLGAALRQAEESGLYTKAREGHDPKFAQDAIAHLRNILPMDFKALNDYYVKMGWIGNPRTKRGFADPAYSASRNVDEIGMAAAVTKEYLTATAVATKQLADAFLARINDGQSAVAEGMAFAQQMQHTSRFGGYVLGWDQGYGRATRQQGILNQLRKTGKLPDPGKEEKAVADALGNLGEYEDKFQGIAAKLQDPMQAADGVNELISLAQRVKFLDDPRKIAKASTTLGVAGNAWTEIFINGLMSSPETFSTNALGAVWAVARPALQYGTAKAYAMSGAPGARYAEQAAAEAGSAIAAMAVAWRDAAKLGWHAFRTETTLYQAGAGLDQTNRAAIHGQHVADFFDRRGWEKPEDGLLDTVTRLGEFVRLPTRAALGVDEAAKHLVVRGEVAAQAVKRAAKEGIDLTDRNALQAFLDQEMKDAFELKGPEVWEKYKVKSIYDLNTGIMAEADRATFQEVNGFAQKVSDVLSWGPLSAVRPFIPFVRTPLNILKQGFYESTGLQAVVKGSQAIAGAGFNPTAAVFNIQKQLLEDPGETFRVTGQIALTTTLAATMYMGAMSGTIVGGGPGRWSGGGKGSKEQKAWEAMMAEQGLVPYSVNVGNTSVPFNRFGEPVAVVLRMAADMGMYSAHVPQASQEEWVAGLAGIMLTGLYQSTFLKGINDLMDLMTDGDAALGVKGGRAVQNWMATQTPFGGLLSFVDRVNDPYKHAYQGATFAEMMAVHEDTFGTGIFAKIADRFPGYGGTPGLVDQVTGKPVPMMPGHGPGGLNPLQMAIPILPRGEKAADDVWSAIYKIKGSYTERRPGGGMKLTHAEQQQLNGRMASVEINGRTLREAILAYSNRADVQAYLNKRGGAFTEVRTKIESEFDDIVNDYYMTAYNLLLGSDRNLRTRKLALEAAQERAMANDAEGAQQAMSRVDELLREAKLRGVF